MQQVNSRNRPAVDEAVEELKCREEIRKESTSKPLKVRHDDILDLSSDEEEVLDDPAPEDQSVAPSARRSRARGSSKGRGKGKGSQKAQGRASQKKPKSREGTRNASATSSLSLSAQLEASRAAGKKVGEENRISFLVSV